MGDPAGKVAPVLFGLNLAQFVADDRFVVEGGVLRAVDDNGAEAGDQPASAEQKGRPIEDYVCEIALERGVDYDGHEDEGDSGKRDGDLEQKRDELVEGLVLLVGLVDQLPLDDLVGCIGPLLPLRTKPLKSL